jgi:hypothetical protein
MKSRFFYCLVIVALLLIIAGTLIYYETPNAGVEQFSEDIYGSNASYRFPVRRVRSGRTGAGFPYTGCNWKGQTINGY